MKCGFVDLCALEQGTSIDYLILLRTLVHRNTWPEPSWERSKSIQLGQDESGKSE